MENDATAFISLIGKAAWRERMAVIFERSHKPTRCSKLAAARFTAEGAIEKARRGMVLGAAELAYVRLTAGFVDVHEQLTPAGRGRLMERLEAAMCGDMTLIPLLHLLHTANLQRARGFEVEFTGLNEATNYDLLISRDNVQAEIACDTISAEDGHAVHRSSWSALIDRIDPELQIWLAAHPGRYLLKMSLPQGLKSGPQELPALQSRIKAMLASASRADHDEAAVLRLDPLLLAGAQATERVMAQLRRDFGPQAHFSVTEAGNSMFVMAARGGEDEVAVAIARRLAAITPLRLSGTRPGILAMMVEDTGRLEWRNLREQLLLEGQARQFLTQAEAKPVIAVTCVSRFELTHEGAAEGDLRFRNPKHEAAKSSALAPAILSTF